MAMASDTLASSYYHTRDISQPSFFFILSCKIHLAARGVCLFSVFPLCVPSLRCFAPLVDEGIIFIGREVVLRERLRSREQRALRQLARLLEVEMN